MPTDEALTGLIQTAILADERLSAQPITLSVSEGTVTLRGSVQTYRRKLAAQEIASSFEGVRDVVNNLTVEPPDQMTDQEVAVSVRATLDANADVTKEAITVSLRNQTVTLNGTVGSQWERIVAEDVARGVRGVRDVENLLVVNICEQREDEARCKQIEEALRHTEGLEKAGILVAVNNKMVVLAGEVREPLQKEAAESTVRRLGVFQIRNDIVVKGG
jgi:osmotically-inducible protein OsmY